MKRYFIIDDDPSIVKMLSLIIEQNNLGKVVMTLNSGKEAVDEILFSHPDIVLIDLLLPGLDGIQIIKQLKEKGFTGKCIMISQVNDAKMISNAYSEGSLFFLSKPINAVEVISILKEVSRIMDLECSMAIIQSALKPIEPKNISNNTVPIDDKLRLIFEDLGISTETGIDELRSVILELLKQKNKTQMHDYQLQEIYVNICKSENTRTIEQRIRRIIYKTFQNLAEIGCDDYYHPIFQTYASILFDIKQMKIEMRRIEDSDRQKGKISIKKFIDGILMLLLRNSNN